MEQVRLDAGFDGPLGRICVAQNSPIFLNGDPE